MTPAPKEVLEALTTGIQNEVASYVFYVTAAKRDIAAEFKEILERLAREEREHFQILERQYDSLVRSEKWISTADILKQKGLPEIGEDMSSQHKELLNQIAAADSMQSLLETALRLEEDAADLYANAAAKADSPEGKNMFQRLVKFEEGHQRTIKEMLAKSA